MGVFVSRGRWRAPNVSSHTPLTLETPAHEHTHLRPSIRRGPRQHRRGRGPRAPAERQHASVAATYFAAASSDAHYVGPTSGGTCTLTSPIGSDDVTSTPKNFSHGTKHAAVSINAVYTSSDNSSDQVRVKGHVTSALTLKKVHNDLRSLELKSSGSMTVSHTVSGSACQGSGEALAEAEPVLFTEKKKGTFTLTRDLVPNSASIFVLVNEKTDTAVAFDLAQTTGTSHATYTAKLKPGHYLIEAESGVTAGGAFLKSAQRTTKASMKNDLVATFTPKKKKHHHHH